MAASPEAADALTARLTALDGTQGPFELTVSEQELTAYARANLAGTPVQDVSIWLEPEGVHLLASVDLGSTHALYAFAQLDCAEGALQVDSLHLALDGHVVPRWIVASLEKAANDALADMQTALRLERITLDAEKALVCGSIN